MREDLVFFLEMLTFIPIFYLEYLQFTTLVEINKFIKFLLILFLYFFSIIHVIIHWKNATFKDPWNEYYERKRNKIKKTEEVKN